MPLFSLPITGLRHHDFARRLDELYRLAPGKRVSISIEHDNPGEPDAVIVYMGQNCVGYVRSGDDRKLAADLIAASGRSLMLGKVTATDPAHRLLWMELTGDEVAVAQKQESPTLPAGWTLKGKTMPADEAEVRLHTMLSSLEMVLGDQEPWEEDMEEWLDYACRNLWRDISRETWMLTKRIMAQLARGSASHPEYAGKADTLQAAIDHMGSPEVRRLQVEQILNMAHSPHMDTLLLQYDEQPPEAEDGLPPALQQLFMQDSEIFMGKMWYQHMPYSRMQAMKTQLAIMIRKKEDAAAPPPSGIPTEWLIEWAKKQGDKHKIDVVRQIVATHEMERSNPELDAKLKNMQQPTEPKSITNNFAEGSVTMQSGSSINGDVEIS